MATSELSAGAGWCTSQLQIVLLGGRNSGKSSVGNLLLGREEFVTKERTTCSRRVGAVGGLWLTVVDTPGWWCDFGVQDTCGLVKREIVNSVSLCSPGPHAFLIAVKVSSAFTEKRRRAVEEHVSLLGERAWGHCVVVFTSNDGSNQTHAQTAGKALCWLREKCGQRCQGVNLSDGDGVAGLLEKIQEAVRGNGSRVFEMQGDVLHVTVGEKRAVEERAQLRLLRVKEHRALRQRSLRPLTDIRIVLLGAKGSGKTSVLNTVLGRDSGLSGPLRRTARCQVGKGVAFGRNLTVVDTPGWWMNYFCDESTVFDKREVAFSLSLCPPGPHAFLLVVRADRAFTDTYRRSVEEHLQLIGDHVWSHAIVVFSVGDWRGGATTEQYIESEGAPLRWLVERCDNRYHVLNNKTKGDGFQVRELIGKIELMVAGGDGYRCDEAERRTAEQLEVKMRRDRERARERLMKRESRRQMARSQLENLDPLPKMRILLAGGRRTGKSSCGNTILGRERFHADAQTTSCAEERARLCGKAVTVLDTPGGIPLTSDLPLDPLSCAILLVVNASSSFTDTHMEELEKQLEAGGGQLWSRAAVLFSYGDRLGDTSIEQHIESEGEPLQTLVDKCGNRYHVLDNKRLEDRAQVRALVEAAEAMLVEERLPELLRGGEGVWKRVSTGAHEQEQDAVTQDLETSRDLTDTDTVTTQSCCSEATDAGGQMVAPAARRVAGWRGLTITDRDAFMSFLASVASGGKRLKLPAAARQRLTLNAPICSSAELGSNLRLNSKGQVRPFSPAHPTVLLVLPQTHNGLWTEDGVVTVQTLCHPALRERTLRRLTESGGLQQLIDQWGNSSLEELEAFIDAYFEMVWEHTMGSFQPGEPKTPASEGDAAVGEDREEEVLSSIDRKLSKLELLEEIRSDLSKLRESLEHSWKTLQELREKSKQEPE